MFVKRPVWAKARIFLALVGVNPKCPLAVSVSERARESSQHRARRSREPWFKIIMRRRDESRHCERIENWLRQSVVMKVLDLAAENNCILMKWPALLKANGSTQGLTAGETRAGWQIKFWFSHHKNIYFCMEIPTRSHFLDFFHESLWTRC